MTRFLRKADEGERDDRLRRLAVRYRAPVVRYFLRRGLNPENAEDCAQDVFMRLAKADEARIDNPEAYLFSIAATVVVDHVRRRRARHEDRHEPFETDTFAGVAISPERIFEDRQSLVRLNSAVDELPSRTREIFLLNRLEGLTYTQLAARYGLSVKSIEKHMSQALYHLRQRFPVEER